MYSDILPARNYYGWRWVWNAFWYITCQELLRVEVDLECILIYYLPGTITGGGEFGMYSDILPARNYNYEWRWVWNVFWYITCQELLEVEVGLECILIYYLPGTTRGGGGSGMYPEVPRTWGSFIGGSNFSLALPTSISKPK